MADNQNRISLTADELKALDLLISVAQSQGVHPAESLSFITAIANVVVNAVKAVVPVVRAVAPVIQAVAPVVAAIAGGAAVSQQMQGGLGNPGNVTLNDLMEIRRRANQP
ncbi:MAG: hypothetical protein WB624_09290 [Xanthobacteraceae bacterium]|jgi:hypothetical protein